MQGHSKFPNMHNSDQEPQQPHGFTPSTLNHPPPGTKYSKVTVEEVTFPQNSLETPTVQPSLMQQTHTATCMQSTHYEQPTTSSQSPEHICGTCVQFRNSMRNSCSSQSSSTPNASNLIHLFSSRPTNDIASCPMPIREPPYPAQNSGTTCQFITPTTGQHPLHVTQNVCTFCGFPDPNVKPSHLIRNVREICKLLTRRPQPQPSCTENSSDPAGAESTNSVQKHCAVCGVPVPGSAQSPCVKLPFLDCFYATPNFDTTCRSATPDTQNLCECCRVPVTNEMPSASQNSHNTHRTAHSCDKASCVAHMPNIINITGPSCIEPSSAAAAKPAPIQKLCTQRAKPSSSAYKAAATQRASTFCTKSSCPTRKTGTIGRTPTSRTTKSSSHDPNAAHRSSPVCVEFLDTSLNPQVNNRCQTSCPCAVLQNLYPEETSKVKSTKPSNSNHPTNQENQSTSF